MDNYVISLIRTWVPVAIGAALAWLATELGIVIDEGTSAAATTVAVGVVIAVYYAAARLVEQKWPGLGRILVALGLAEAPKYPLGGPQSPADR